MSRGQRRSKAIASTRLLSQAWIGVAMKMIVLGASGYVGGTVSTFLQARGHQVAAQMRTKPAMEPKWPDRFDKVFLGDPADPKIQNKITSESFDAAVFPIAVDFQNTQIRFQQVLAVSWTRLGISHSPASKNWRVHIFLDIECVRSIRARID